MQQPLEWVAFFLLVDPVDGGRLPADELLGLEPERDLLLRGVDGVGAVADVAADLNVESRGRLDWVVNTSGDKKS